MKKYDAAIIGAGPAGAVFAMELAKKCPSLKILLIDGQIPERTKPCGGLLAPDAQKVLAQFDLTLPKSILADPQIFAVETIDLCSKRVRFYQRHYLNMNRYAFDQWLIAQVPDSVDIIHGRVTRLEGHNGEYRVYIDGIGEVDAKNVIGADGASSVVRRTFIGALPKQYVSIQEWYPDTGKTLPYYSCIFDPETSDSCSWMIRKDGCVVFGGAFDKKGCSDAFARQRTRLEAFLGGELGDPIRREACLVTSPRKMSDFICGKDGAFLIGEAAGFISASSFEGISSAIVSASALADAFAAGKDSAEVLKLYKKSTLKLRLKLFAKSAKRIVLCSPLMRGIIMSFGIQSIKAKGR